MGIAARWVAEDGAWVHLVGGEHLAFDGWVAAAEVTKVPRTFDWEHGTELDENDVCDDAPTPARDAPVWVGRSPTGEPVLRAEPGGALTLRASEGPFVAFEWQNNALEAPRGQRFWIRRSDVLVHAEAGVDENGCPRR
jgi:hypothetical protein